MTNESRDPPTNDRPIGDCTRVALLLSLSIDGAATPSQQAEIDAHLPACAACRRAAAGDAAVRRRLLERADAPAPSWLQGFAARTAALAKVEAREARSQNRLLWMSAAAAVLVAVAAQFAARTRPAAAGDFHEATRVALLSSVRPEGK